MAYPTDIGAQVKVIAGIPPTNDDGTAAINGAAIDRLGFQSAVLQVANGVATGAPTSYTIDAKLQESADGSTGWTDISGAAITQITADNSDEYVDVNLAGAKRYIRVVATTAFVGGTSPTVPVAATVVLDGAAEKPVA